MEKNSEVETIKEEKKSRWNTAYSSNWSKEKYAKYKYREFKVVPPGYKDDSTGEILNDSYHQKRVVVKSDVDLQESIQSYADSCSLTSLLNKVKKTGDASLLVQTSTDRFGEQLPLNDQEKLRDLNEKMNRINEVLPSLQSKIDSAKQTTSINDLTDEELTALRDLIKKGQSSAS